MGLWLGSRGKSGKCNMEFDHKEPFKWKRHVLPWSRLLYVPICKPVCLYWNRMNNQNLSNYMRETGPPDEVIGSTQCVENEMDCTRLRAVTVKEE